METDLELTFSLQASTFAVWLWILTLARQFRDKQGGVEAFIWRVRVQSLTFIESMLNVRAWTLRQSQKKLSKTSKFYKDQMRKYKVKVQPQFIKLRKIGYRTLQSVNCAFTDYDRMNIVAEIWIQGKSLVFKVGPGMRGFFSCDEWQKNRCWVHTAVLYHFSCMVICKK